MAGKYIHTYTIISGVLTVVTATGSAFGKKKPIRCV